MHKFVSLLVNFHKTVYHKELDKLHYDMCKILFLLLILQDFQYYVVANSDVQVPAAYVPIPLPIPLIVLRF